MRFLEWLTGSTAYTDEPRPRPFEEIRAEVERRESPHLDRLSRVEESLLSLTAEAGLEDLRRQMENLRRQAP
jgi:hypothetical protein